MISDRCIMDSFSSRWRRSFYWSPAVGIKGGIATFLSDDLQPEVVLGGGILTGQVLSILVKLDRVYINLVNVYAPTMPVERAPFYQSVHSFFFPHSGGDFNCYDSPSDKFNGNVL